MWGKGSLYPKSGVGWLSRGANVGFYQYGYPTGTKVESNVSAQWLFDEASGDIVDEVGSITCTKVNTGQTYRVDTSAYSPIMEYGITTVFNTGWRYNGVVAALAPGTDDWVIEIVFKYPSADTGGDWIDTRDPDSVDVGGFQLTGSTTTKGIVLSVTADDGTFITRSFTASAQTLGAWAKVRCVVNRAGNCETFFNGVSLGTLTMSTVAGKNVPAHGCSVGIRSNAINTMIGTYNELRVSVGTITNNSGGLGGG